MTAWTTPKTWNTNDILTSADMDTYVRDNSKHLFERILTGSVNYTLVSGGGTGPSAVSGSTSYGVTYTGSVRVFLMPIMGSNVDVAMNLQSAPTTTGFSWRVFTANRNATATDSGSFLWLAIGTLA